MNALSGATFPWRLILINVGRRIIEDHDAVREVSGMSDNSGVVLGEDPESKSSDARAEGGEIVDEVAFTKMLDRRMRRHARPQ